MLSTLRFKFGALKKKTYKDISPLLFIIRHRLQVVIEEGSRPNIGIGKDEKTLDLVGYIRNEWRRHKDFSIKL